MEATVVLVLVLTFLVGGMVLALAMGYRSIEEGRAEEAARAAARPRARDFVVVPSFFVKPANDSPLGTPMAFDDALLARLEQHVRAEHAMAAQFVRYPSVDSLYRQSASELHVH